MEQYKSPYKDISIRSILYGKGGKSLKDINNRKKKVIGSNILPSKVDVERLRKSKKASKQKSFLSLRKYFIKDQ